MSYYDNVILGAPPDESDKPYFRLEDKVLTLLRTNGFSVIADELAGTTAFENALEAHLEASCDS
ncbi:hypothetical protein NYR72_10085 [Actinobacillus equuli subsp. haemolyticus]|uniref:hypothetical protein n=1 Tax=Actinobacillus equuli TaxID=718 RepID=UPI0024188BFF|nr:hypothetical protein [Actinobacillus equuli]MDG4948840.1 hypothetical protein [Actinobacillus equuli subsp. haemolyticus]